MTGPSSARLRGKVNLWVRALALVRKLAEAQAAQAALTTQIWKS
jgi:hypothetical protein